MGSPVTDEDTRVIDQAKPKIQMAPSKMPNKPAEVHNVQPQASLSGVHDCNHGVDFALHFVCRKVSPFLEDACQSLPIVDGLAFCNGLGESL